MYGHLKLIQFRLLQEYCRQAILQGHYSEGFQGDYNTIQLIFFKSVTWIKTLLTLR